MKMGGPYRILPEFPTRYRVLPDFDWDAAEGVEKEKQAKLERQTHDEIEQAMQRRRDAELLDRPKKEDDYGIPPYTD
jgi:hypothetical protein